jgi:serine/threonine-protein kinase
MKRRDSDTPTPIDGTANARSFALSPDGEWIAYGQGTHLKKVRVAGGAPVTLVARDVVGEAGVAWLDDGTIVFSDGAKGTPRLAKVSADGSNTAIIWSDSLAGVLPEPVFGKRAVLFSACSAPDKCGEWALDLRSGKAHALTPGARWAQYSPSGHLLYVLDGRLLAVAFDASRLEARGQPVSLADRISGNPFPIRLSRGGTLVTLVGGTTSLGALLEMVWVDRAGRITPVDTTWRFNLTNLGNSHGWALSSDGSRLAVGLYTDAGDHIWQKVLPHGSLSRMSFGVGSDSRPHWSADGRSIMFTSVQASGGVVAVRADGTGKDSLVLRGNVDEAAASADGEWLVVRVGLGGPGPGGRDIFGYHRGDTTRRALIVTKYDEEAIAISPDSKWIAYQSDETGKTEVFVRSFPNTDGYKQQVSNNGGQAPLWSRDGRELFFMSAAHNMMAVRVTAAATLAFGEPTVLFHAPDELLSGDYTYYTPWDVARDGRFIMSRAVRATQDYPPTTVVTENWLQELRAKMKH